MRTRAVWQNSSCWTIKFVCLALCDGGFVSMLLVTYFSLFLQVIVRLASPISMDLVLRKRISVKVYKRQSWKDSLLKKITRVSTFILFVAPETLRGMGTSFLRNDFWDRLGRQALVMIGRWYLRQLLTNHK